MDRMRAVIFDCESTGLKDARIIESGLIHVDVRDGILLYGTPELSRFNPGKPSDLGAINVHHILDSELEGMPCYTTFSLPDYSEYVIGQNVDYDMQVIGNPLQYKRICTVGMARKLWPEADSHSLGCMMYHLFGRTDATRQMLKDAHSAMADCRMTYLLVEEILKRTGIQNLEELHLYSEECKISTAKMPFGKYRGQYLVDLVKTDRGYLLWLTSQKEMDENIRGITAKVLGAV